MTRSASHISGDAHNPLGPQLLERLRAICGAEHVLTQPIQLRTSDGLLQHRATPGAVVLPAAAPGELVTAIARVRNVLAPAPCVVLDAPPNVRAHLDSWDHPEDAALVLMRRVKERFDTTRTCNPGIFVGGI